MSDAALVEDSLAAALRGRSDDRFELAVDRAVGLGPAGEALLVDALASTASWRRVVLAANLGDATGPRGPAALRELLGVTGPGSRDLRCAALLALAKRLGAEATQDLADALAISDPEVHDYAGLALSKVGDDRAWESVLAGLSTLLQRRGQPSAWPPRILGDRLPGLAREWRAPDAPGQHLASVMGRTHRSGTGLAGRAVARGGPWRCVHR